MGLLALPTHHHRHPSQHQLTEVLCSVLVHLGVHPHRSVLTYSRLSGHVKTLTFCQGSHYLAVASDSGAVQLLAVEANKPPKSPKVQPFQSR